MKERDVDQIVNEAESSFQRTLQTSFCNSNYSKNSSINYILFEIRISTMYLWSDQLSTRDKYISAKKNYTEAKSEQLVTVSWEKAVALWLPQQNMNLHLFRSKSILPFFQYLKNYKQEKWKILQLGNKLEIKYGDPELALNTSTDCSQAATTETLTSDTATPKIKATCLKIQK